MGIAAINKYFFALVFICLLFCTACGKNHPEQVLESMQAVELAMRMNVDNPEGLFAALDECIVKYKPVWKKSAHLLETKSYESYMREYNLHVEALQKVQLSIINLDLEIQDNLRNDPEMLQKYFQKLEELGARD